MTLAAPTSRTSSTRSRTATASSPFARRSRARRSRSASTSLCVPLSPSTSPCVQAEPAADVVPCARTQTADHSTTREKLVAAQTSQEHLEQRVRDLVLQVEAKEEKLAIFEGRSSSGETDATRTVEEQLQVTVADLRCVPRSHRCSPSWLGVLTCAFALAATSFVRPWPTSSAPGSTPSSTRPSPRRRARACARSRRPTTSTRPPPSRRSPRRMCVPVLALLVVAFTSSS